MGVRGSLQMISMETYDSLVKGKDDKKAAESLVRYDLHSSYHWLHEVFKHQRPPLDKTISGDRIPKALEGDKLGVFAKGETKYECYMALMSPRLVVDIAQELSLVTESTWRRWCTEQEVEDLCLEEFTTVKYAYNEAAGEQKPLMILIV